MLNKSSAKSRTSQKMVKAWFRQDDGWVTNTKRGIQGAELGFEQLDCPQNRFQRSSIFTFHCSFSTDSASKDIKFTQYRQIYYRTLLINCATVFVCVRASAQSTKCDGVVSNTRESSMCHGDGTMKNMSVMHQRSLGLCLERGKAQMKVCSIEVWSNSSR